MSSSSPKITLHPALPTDLLPLSRLENYIFYNEPFSAVAYGPERGSEENIAKRAAIFANAAQPGEQRWRYVKAVSENGEIVGFAGWGFVPGEKGADEVKEEKGGKDGNEKKENSWGVGANAKFCEDAFVVADKLMVRSCGGKDYAKLGTIVVSPDCQRQGIGTLLMEEGLKEVDRLGLQCVLGASPEGEGLYKKYGFGEVEVMELKLWEYEGGEGMGVARHVVMHRPAKTSV